MSGGMLDAGTIQAYLHEVADELIDSGNVQHVLVLVGGALLAWGGLRETTLDVDSVRRLDNVLRAAVVRVADRHGLAAGWGTIGLQASPRPACATKPARNCGNTLACSSSPRLGETSFLMKLFAARERDWDDLVALWPRSGFTDAADAVSQYYEAYPHETVDRYLVGHVENIAMAASPQ